LRTRPTVAEEKNKYSVTVAREYRTGSRPENNWPTSEASETLSGVTNGNWSNEWKLEIHVCIYICTRDLL